MSIKTNQKKFVKTIFTFKILLAYLAIYIGFAVGFAIFSNKNYEYRNDSIFQYSSTILMQPVMELFADGKISHWYDWKNIKYESINQEVPPVKIYSKSNEVYFDHTKTYSFDIVKAEFFEIKDQVIIKPKNYDGKWSVVYCTEDKNTCKESNILANNEIKLLVPNNFSAWGVDEKGNYIQLVVQKYTTKGEYKNLILI